MDDCAKELAEFFSRSAKNTTWTMTSSMNLSGLSVMFGKAPPISSFLEEASTAQVRTRPDTFREVWWAHRMNLASISVALGLIALARFCPYPASWEIKLNARCSRQRRSRVIRLPYLCLLHRIREAELQLLYAAPHGRRLAATHQSQTLATANDCENSGEDDVRTLPFARICRKIL